MVHAELTKRSLVPAGGSYELRTAFPAKLLTDFDRTLEELHLVPSATLCVRVTGA